MNYTQADKILQGRSFNQKKIMHNTLLLRIKASDDSYYFAIRYYNTEIIRMYSGDVREINLDGWTTTATMDRLRKYVPAIFVRDKRSDCYRVFSCRSEYPQTKEEIGQGLVLNPYGLFRFSIGELPVVTKQERLHKMECLIPGHLWRSRGHWNKPVDNPFTLSKVTEKDRIELLCNTAGLPNKYKWHLTRGKEDLGYFETMRAAQLRAYEVSEQWSFPIKNKYGYHPRKESNENVYRKEDLVSSESRRRTTEGGMGVIC